ncbi:MAG: PilT/PilU family type 4a pilus ATPase [Desulfobacterales bacterium]
MINELIEIAKAKGASDLHLEPGLPIVYRISGKLEIQGEPVSSETLNTLAQQIVNNENWAAFLSKGSFDTSMNIQNVRCRINVLRTNRGIGFAIRLLSSFQPTVEKLNLHPDINEVIKHSHGLVLFCGPTGSGKSSTMAALIQELNQLKPKHIITIESPVEYHFKMIHSIIRQREVGRDTPSFYQGIIDSMREDPDVLMVGEMREPEVMRETLNAAETGHLVFATIHSGSSGEAIYRLVNAFPAEMQDNVRAQIADCLLAVICQRLAYRSDINMRVPECEILFANFAIKSIIRSGKYSKIEDVLQTGSEDKMWTFQRYRKWLNNRKTWHFPKNESSEKPIELNRNDEVLNSDMMIKSKFSSNVNVSKHSKSVSINKSKLESKTDQNGVYKINEPEDIDRILDMFEKPKNIID